MRLSKSTFNSFTINKDEENVDKVTGRLYKMSGIIQESSGIFQYNYLIKRVIDKIEGIIRFYMDNEIGAFEIRVPTIQDLDVWKAAGREQTYGPEMFKLKDRKGHDICLAATAEAYVTNLVKKTIQSYKQLPFTVYQITDKYRDEIRPRFGLVRGRQFIMKDSYTFCSTHEEQEDLYYKHYNAYLDIFAELGLEVISIPADPGQIGGKSSHEFAVFSEFGEDIVNYHQEEIPPAEKVKSFEELKINKNSPQPTAQVSMYPDFNMKYQKKVLEVGHIFYLDQSYSIPLGANFSDKDNTLKPFIMGSFGIGVSRIIHVLYEKYKFLPLSVSPFQIHIVSVKNNEEHEEIYEELKESFEVLFDDRDKSFAQKIEDANLIGIPIRVILGRNIELVDFRGSDTGTIHIMRDKEELFDFLFEHI